MSFLKLRLVQMGTIQIPFRNEVEGWTLMKALLSADAICSATDSIINKGRDLSTVNLLLRF